MIELGKMGKDKITGFEGIITGYCQYIYGCGQYLLTPVIKEGNDKKESHWLDEGRIEEIGDGITAKEVQTDEPGGIRCDAPPCR